MIFSDTKLVINVDNFSDVTVKFFIDLLVSLLMIMQEIKIEAKMQNKKYFLVLYAKISLVFFKDRCVFPAIVLYCFYNEAFNIAQYPGVHSKTIVSSKQLAKFQYMLYFYLRTKEKTREGW